MRRSDGRFVWIGKQDPVLGWSRIVAARATPRLSSWDSSWPGYLSYFVRINHYQTVIILSFRWYKSVIYIYFSSLRCRVCQPRAEKEDSEAFTASARLVQTSHLITGTYSRWAVHRSGGRQKVWRFYEYPFGVCGWCRRGRGTIEARNPNARRLFFTRFYMAMI